MRYLYSVLLYLAMPFILIRLLWRSRRQPLYRKRLVERFGFYPKHFQRSIWVHTVSVGETIAAIPLIKALQQHYPDLPMVVTTMTPTGAERVIAALGNSVTHLYLPYDLPDAAERFVRAINPEIAIIMETEWWPNLLFKCQQKKIPVCLINARLSEKSARGYQRVASLSRDMLQCFTVIAAQSRADAERFVRVGAPRNRVQVTGNIKFDFVLPADIAEHSIALRAQLGKDRFIWIAASTHAGEEEIILAAQQKIREQNPQALLILVPRHVDRFNQVAEVCATSFVTSRRSLSEAVTDQTAVYLADTMGELPLLYSVADATFVGGSLIPRGGHNVLEPAALAKPIITGYHLFNFTEVSQLLFAADALVKVNDATELAAIIIQLMNDTDARTQLGLRALDVMEANRGALQKQFKLITELVSNNRTP